MSERTFKGALLGPHIIGGVGNKLDQLERWTPRLVVVLDGKPEEASNLRGRLPHACLVNRIYRPDSEVTDRIRANPKEAAHWADQVISEKRSEHWDYYILENEVLQSEHDGSLELLNTYCLERMRLADRSGYKAAIAGFSVGNPDLPDGDRMRAWRKMYPALTYAAQYGHVVSVHQYGQPTLWEPDPEWHIHRLEKQVLPRLPSPTFNNLRWIVGEEGIDGRLYEDSEEGYKRYTDATSYAQDLISLTQYQAQWADKVIGYAVFTYGNLAGDGWSSYNIEGSTADMLANHGWRQAAITVFDKPTSQPSKPEPKPEPKPKPEPQPKPEVEQIKVWMSPGAEAGGADPVVDRNGEWAIRRIFTTQDGSWEVNPNHKYGIDQESRDMYLDPAFTKAGGDHGIYVRFETADGVPITRQVAQLRNTEGTLSFPLKTTEAEAGWVEQPIFEGYNPETDTGAWIVGPADELLTRVEGLGMPEGLHVSWFVVFAKRAARAQPDSDVAAVSRPTPMHRMIQPVMNANVTQQYGDNPEMYAHLGQPYHNGVDYGGRLGDAIYAVADGVVAFTGWDDGYGNYIRIWHPDWGFHSFYGHLNEIQVKPGQGVAVGDMIGTMGSTGYSTGPHLHFEIRLAYAGGTYAPSPDAGMTQGRVSPETVFAVVSRIRNEQT